MQTFIRSLILFALVLWIGGVLFFAAVVAPVAFGPVLRSIPDPATGFHIAGTFVRISLFRLHAIGMACGFLLILLTIFEKATLSTRRSIKPHLVLLAVMLAFTAISQFAILPRMEVLRTQPAAAIDNPAVTTPAREKFNRLHRLSTQLESGVLLCGLALIVLYARPESSR